MTREEQEIQEDVKGNHHARRETQRKMQPSHTLKSRPHVEKGHEDAINEIWSAACKLCVHVFDFDGN